MKKILSIALLCTLLLSLAIIPSAAEKKNIMTIDNFEVIAEFGLTSNSKYIPEYQFDGNNVYNKDDASTYCDYKLADGKSAMKNGTAMKYDITGDPGAMETPYYAGVHYKLDKAYTISGIAFYFQNATEGVPQAGNIDGFDFFVSETGEDGSWKKVASFSEMLCGKKLQVATDETTGLQTCYVTADFEPVTVQYFAYGISDSRCQHAEALLAATGLEPNANPHYYRISEIEIYEGDASAATSAPETTAAPETTTAAPVTTAAPATTAAPTQTPSTADAMPVICLGLMLAAAACLMLRRKFN